jgi:putative transposase
MKQGRFTEEQIAFALKQLDEKLISVPELSRKMGVSQQTIYKWRNRYAGMSVSEVRKLKALEEKNRQLKRLVADLSLDKHMLQDVLSKKF